MAGPRISLRETSPWGRLSSSEHRARPPRTVAQRIPLDPGSEKRSPTQLRRKTAIAAPGDRIGLSNWSGPAGSKQPRHKEHHVEERNPVLHRGPFTGQSRSPRKVPDWMCCPTSCCSPALCPQNQMTEVEAAGVRALHFAHQGTPAAFRTIHRGQSPRRPRGSSFRKR